jgi:hypothetical protein
VFDFSFRTAYGTITLAQVNGALRFHWGVLEGPVEVFDAERDQLRIEVAGSGTVLTVKFEGAGKATAVEMPGVRFGRT